MDSKKGIGGRNVYEYKVAEKEDAESGIVLASVSEQLMKIRSFMVVKEKPIGSIYGLSGSKEQKAFELTSLNHPNIVRYIGCTRTADSVHIFLELVVRGSLVDVTRPSKMTRKLRNILHGCESSVLVVEPEEPFNTSEKESGTVVGVEDIACEYGVDTMDQGMLREVALYNSRIGQFLSRLDVAIQQENERIMGMQAWRIMKRQFRIDND